MKHPQISMVLLTLFLFAQITEGRRHMFSSDWGDWFEGAFEETEDWFHGAWDDTEDWFHGAWDDTEDWVGGAWDDTEDWVEGAWDDTDDWFHGAWDDTDDWVDGAWDDTEDWVEGAWDDTIHWIEEQWQELRCSVYSASETSTLYEMLKEEKDQDMEEILKSHSSVWPYLQKREVQLSQKILDRTHDEWATDIMLFMGDHLIELSLCEGAGNYPEDYKDNVLCIIGDTDQISRHQAHQLCALYCESQGQHLVSLNSCTCNSAYGTTDRGCGKTTSQRAKANFPPLKCNSKITDRTYSQSGTTYPFVAEHEKYIFESCETSSWDTKLYLMDSGGNQIHYNDDHGGKCKFGNHIYGSHIQTNLQVGEEYTLKITGYSSGDYGDLKFRVGCPGYVTPEPTPAPTPKPTPAPTPPPTPSPTNQVIASGMSWRISVNDPNADGSMNRVITSAISPRIAVNGNNGGCAKEDAVVVYDDGNQIHDTGYASFGDWYEVLDARAAATLPEEACNTVMNDVNGKIAVIKRGACYFSTKIRNAQSAGALAVIILNNGGYNLDYMTCPDHSCDDIIIPSVFLDDDSALELLEMLESDPDHIYHVGCESN